MEVKLYVNWNDEEILTEEQMKKRIASDTEDFETEGWFVNEVFGDKGYSLWDLWTMDENDKQTATEELKAACRERAETDFADDFEECSIEV